MPVGTVQFGETALMVAAFNGWYRVVRRLVDAGANLEAKNRVCDCTVRYPLLQKHACSRPAPNTRLAQLKRTPLVLAASEGHANVVATLLRAGADFESMEAGVRAITRCLPAHETFWG